MEEKNDVFKVDENQPKKDNQKKLILILGVAIVLVAVILTIVLVNAIVSIGTGNENTSQYQTTQQVQQSTTESAADQWLNSESGTNVVDSNVSETASELNSNNDIKVDVSTTKNQLIESYEYLSVNGENRLSDHHDNEYIKLVSEKYGVDTDLLVAIYSVPDTGTNFVLQFDGDKNLKGDYVKSPDNLVKVYQIDKEKNIKVATGTPTGNEGVSYAESVMSVAMIKTIVMKQYPNYFSDLD